MQDALEWTGADRFRPLGRIDQVLQVAGVNVFPARVAALLREHPAVLDASVRPMRADEGDRLKAFIVPRPSAIDGDVLRAELGSWARERLGDAERPMAYSFGERLPRQASGKLADWIIETAG